MLWTINQFPELDHLDPEQREQILKRVPRWTYPLLIGRAVMGALFIGGFVGVSTSRGPGEVFAITVAVTAAVFAPVLYQVQLRLLRIDMRKVIIAGFRGQRPPFCLGCGYDLRGSDAATCPECGAALARG